MPIADPSATADGAEPSKSDHSFLRHAVPSGPSFVYYLNKAKASFCPAIEQSSI